MMQQLNEVRGDLVSKITQMFSRERGISKPQDTTNMGYGQDPTTLALSALRFSSEKPQIIKKCKDMWQERGQNYKIIQIISTFLSKGGFTVTVQPKEKELTNEEQQAQKILKDVLQRTHMLSNLKGWMTSLPRDGIFYGEIEVANNRIERVTKLASEITFENADNRGRTFRDGGEIDINKAFTQESYAIVGLKIDFADWQICKIDWNPIQGEGGSPQFMSARKLHKKVEDSENSVYIRRRSKAGDKLQYKIGTDEKPGTPEEITEYENKLRKAFPDPLVPFKDIVTNEKVAISKIPGDSGVTQIADIEYLQQQYYEVGGVPMLLIPGQEQITLRAGAEQSIEGFMGMIQDCNEAIGAEFKRSIFDLELLLNGINPDSINYQIVWGEKIKKNEKELEERIIAKRKAGLISLDTGMRELGIEDTEGEKERIKAEMLEFPQVPVETGARYYVGANPLGLSGSLGQMGEAKRVRRIDREEKNMLMEIVKELKQGIKEIKERR